MEKVAADGLTYIQFPLRVLPDLVHFAVKILKKVILKKLI